MKMDEHVYCENGNCRVILFETWVKDGEVQSNCPGCGQFGRIKNKAEEER